MSRHPFDLLMELGTDQIWLDCAALHLAHDAYPNISISYYLGVLDSMAAEVGALRPGLAANLRYRALRSVLVESYSLTGTPTIDNPPETIYLNRVLDRGLGVPISLSIVWIEVARRLKWPVSGVALPGHFFVRLDDPERFVLADPFRDGQALTLTECERLVEEATGGKVPFTMDLLKPVDTREVLVQLLRALRNTYLAANDMARLTGVLRRLAAADPANGQHLQDLAAVCCRRGDVRGAYAHLALCLRRSPRGSDAQIVRDNLQKLHAAMLALN